MGRATSRRRRCTCCDKIFPEGIHIPDYFLGKNIVHLPTVKCHIYTTTTGAMKNAFGGLLHTHRHYTHSWIHETLVDLLAIQKEIHPGVFAVMDGTTAGNGPGPRTMYPGGQERHARVGRPGGDRRGRREDDGLRPDDASSTSGVAHEDGLGVGRSARHRDRRRRRRRTSRGASTWATTWRSIGGDLFWFSPLKVFQKLLFHTPIVHLFVFASRDLPRLLPVADEGPPDVRAVAAGHGVGELFTEYGGRAVRDQGSGHQAAWQPAEAA